MKVLKTFLFIFLIFSKINAQELNCIVQVNSSQVQTSEIEIFDNLRQDIYEFMNSRRWTDYEYKQNEKIESNIQITISGWDNIENFTATIQVQAGRPVYNSSYNSVLINHMDKDFTFKYVQGQPIDFIENTFTSNLASVLAFYAYIIIGLDFDSFSKFEGTQYYDKAQSIVTSAQNAPDKGWKSFENQRNRYWLVENLLNQSYSALREGIYEYHRTGLDVLHNDLSSGRQAIVNAMQKVQTVYRQKPGLFFITLFMTAKSDELVNIFIPAPAAEKMRIVTILRNIDPANSSKYNEILQQ